MNIKKKQQKWNFALIVPGCLLTVLAFLFIFLLLSLVSFLLFGRAGKKKAKELIDGQAVKVKQVLGEIKISGEIEVSKDYLTPNSYSRPQIALKQVNGIVIHYVENPGSTAEENRNYFENLKDNHATKASCHFIVGLSGEVIQCIPLDEIAYASNERNSDTISIENCHPDEDGKFNKSTYDALVALTGQLCIKYGLSERDVIRHYDVTGKQCPLYFVKHEEAWESFRDDVRKVIEEESDG